MLISSNVNCGRRSPTISHHEDFNTLRLVQFIIENNRSTVLYFFHVLMPKVAQDNKLYINQSINNFLTFIWNIIIIIISFIFLWEHVLEVLVFELTLYRTGHG